ncbi:MAG: oligosaccharide flippase family protein, partial [Pseudomonadota bacterium]
MKAGTVKSNSIVLIGGRIILSAGRLLVVIILVRMSGTETFGGYALILSLVAFFDWLVDFGQTDIAVREIASDGNKRAAWLGALGRNKLIMGLLGGALVPILSILLGYSEEIIAGAFVGGFAVMLHALLQVPRTILKLEMRQDRDILGEVAGFVAMLITLSIAARAG